MKLLILIIFISESLFAQIIDYKTFQSDFLQNITNPSGKVISYKGNIILKDNNKILWTYTTPILKQIYILDSDVIINEPELEQTIYTKVQKELNFSTLLNNAIKIDSYTYQSIINNTKYTLFIKKGILQSISYTDEIENKVSIIFSNQVIDKEIDSKTFLFDQDPDFDIIKR